MRNVIVSAIVLAVLIVVARAYTGHHDPTVDQPGPSPSQVSTDDSDTCARLTQYLHDHGFTVDDCTTENTVPHPGEPHDAAHT